MKKFYYTIILEETELTPFIQIAKNYLDKIQICVEDSIGSCYCDYDNTMELEADIRKFYNKATREDYYEKEENDNFYITVSLRDKELSFETVADDNKNGYDITQAELMYKIQDMMNNL